LEPVEARAAVDLSVAVVQAPVAWCWLGDTSCYDWEEFFLSSVGDRGDGRFCASKDNGDVCDFRPSGPPTNKSWSNDFDDGTPEKVGNNGSLGSSKNVGIFLF
jgi:hypothetical protein